MHLLIRVGAACFSRCGIAFFAGASAFLQAAELPSRPGPGPAVPRVVDVSPAGPDLLVVRIQVGQIERPALLPYRAQSGDEIREDRRGGILFSRRVERDGRHLGFLSGANGRMIVLADRYSEERLRVDLADRTDTYALSSPEDPAYREPVRPIQVSRKAKPTTFARHQNTAGPLHTVYLQWPQALREGATYLLDLGSLNVDRPNIEHLHWTERQRSEAVHVNQNGFAPADSIKRAFVSLWMGSGGGRHYGPTLRFRVIDEVRGDSVFSGAAGVHWPSDREEEMSRVTNYTQADVYRLDFPSVSRPGRYRVHVEGIGCSPAFEIRPDVWERAVVTSLRGLFHHRSGIELGPPQTEFWRPRPHHPADGVVVKQSTATLLGTSMGPGYRGPDAFAALVAGATEETLPQAWGGMMDAADWDRRAQHLVVPRLLFEMFELAPAFYSSLELNLPESGDSVPDVLDEARWILDFFLRMQTADGGVRGGVEAAAHPAAGDVSWNEQLPLFAYAPDFWSTHEFVSAAARAAVVLAPTQADRATAYAAAAHLGMQWAEPRYAEALRRREGDLPWAELIDARNLAALALYRLSGDEHWHRVFLEESVLLQEDGALRSGRQREALFVYARLAAGRGRDDLKARARDALIADARRAVDYAAGNAFSHATAVPDRSVFLGFLAGPVDGAALVRGHVLTGHREFLDTLLASSQYGLGANPDNLSFTTGLGTEPPRWVLHEDSFKTGREAPPGITVYGAFDHGASFVEPDSWWLQAQRDFPLSDGRLYPRFQDWPVHESYLDMWGFIAQNEYTPWQTMAPSAYVWGYLAAVQRPHSASRTRN